MRTRIGLLIGSGAVVVGALVFLSQRDSGTPKQTLTERPAGTANVASGDLARATGAAQADMYAEDAAPSSSSSVAAAVQAPTPPPQPRAWDGGAYRSGERAFQAGDYETARDALEDAVAERDDVPYRHYLLGLTYMRLHQPENAVMEFEVAREQAPDNVRVLVNLARARVELHDFGPARTALEHALQLAPQDADAHVVLGRALLWAGDAETAASEFTTATQLSPDLAWAWNDLGYVRIQQEQFDQAIPPLREATRLRDDVACFYNNLGVALERTGDLIGARIAYGKAGQLGHELASNSSQRVETVLLARGVDPSRWEQVAAPAARADTTATTVGLNSIGRQ